MFWTNEANKAFQDIKAALYKDPVLYCPKFEEPIVLQVMAMYILSHT